LRIPALFGPGAARSFLDDLCHEKNLDRVNPVSIHQWYPINRIARDLVIARHLKAKTVNLATEPLPVQALLNELRICPSAGFTETPAPYSRITTRYSAAFGGARGYILSAQEILAQIKQYITIERRLQVKIKPLQGTWPVDRQMHNRLDIIAQPICL
jgi:hypothetical protein